MTPLEIYLLTVAALIAVCWFFDRRGLKRDIQAAHDRASMEAIRFNQIIADERDAFAKADARRIINAAFVKEAK